MAAKTHFNRTGAGGSQWANSFYQPLDPVGNVFYVDSATGTSAGPGWSAENAYATIGQAIAQCTANNGDVIRVMPGHSETFSTATTHITFSVAGVTIEGVGSGAGRPTLTFSHTGATLSVTAAGVTIRNLLLVTDVDSVVTYCTVSGADFTAEDLELRDQTDKEVITDFTITGDRPTFRRCFKNGYTAGNANDCVLSLNGVDRALIEDCRFITSALTAVVEFVTAASTMILLRDCWFWVTGVTDKSKNVVDTITGSTWGADRCFDIGAVDTYMNGSGA